MSTLNYHCGPSATETSLPALQDRAQCASADLARQQKRLDALIATFEKQKSTVTPQVYVVMQGEVEQQRLIVHAAVEAQRVAEAAHANAQYVASQQEAARVRLQRLETLDAALLAKTQELVELQRLIGELPERLLRARGEHMRLQAERAAIAG